MTDDEVGLQPPGANRGEDRQARRDERGLLHLRLDELELRRLEGEVEEIEIGRATGELQHLERLGDSLGDLTSHAGLERSLAGETECDLSHQRSFGSVHRSRAEPHVRPAPIPVIRTSAPSRSRPSACASASASGIDPDDVLP